MTLHRLRLRQRHPWERRAPMIDRLELMSQILHYDHALEESHDVFLLALEAFVQLLDFRQAYNVSFYSILQNPSTLPQDELLSGYVDVKMASPGQLVWQGSVLEAASRAPVRSNTGPGKGRKRKHAPNTEEQEKAVVTTFEPFEGWLNSDDAPAAATSEKKKRKTGNAKGRVDNKVTAATNAIEDMATAMQEPFDQLGSRASHSDSNGVSDDENDGDGSDLELSSNNGLQENPGEQSESESDADTFDFDFDMPEAEDDLALDREPEPEAEAEGAADGDNTKQEGHVGKESGKGETNDEDEKLSFLRRPKAAELALDIPDVGQIRYNYMDEYFRAKCNHPDHGTACLRRRSAVESGRGTSTKKSAGQGRPIGSLVAWLLQANKFPDQKSHVKAAVASKHARVAGRRLCMQQPAAEDMVQFERKQREGESSEPEDIL